MDPRILITLFLLYQATSATSHQSPTRFYSDDLAREESTTTIRDSRPGDIMASVANGYLGTIVYSDTVHIAGIYSGKAYPKPWPAYPLHFYEHTHRARLPSTCAVNFSLSERENITGKSSYALDVSEAVFYRWFKADGGTFDVEQRIYAHRSRKHLLVVEISVNNSLQRDVTLTLTTNRGGISRDVDLNETVFKPGLRVAVGKVKVLEESNGYRANVAMVWDEIPANLTVRASGEQHWYFITAIVTSLDNTLSPENEALNQWKDASWARKDLLASHKDAWKTLWSTGRIDVEGDLQLSQAIYSSMYNILSSTRADWPYGLSPGGLPGGEEYMGHTFWDQDIWMYPVMVLLYPDLARASLRYRYDRLPAARRIARKWGYKGAMFPWESSLSGIETSPGEKYGRYQNHITGDIAYAAQLYWHATKDYQWLKEIGYALAYQTAEYWASRVSFDNRKEKYVIEYVMPPDEYQFPVDNSVYTNVVAKINLEFAVKVCTLLGRYYPKMWVKIAEQMYIPFDSDRNFHPEFDLYDLGYQAKQADTILIGYPLMYNMSRQVRYNDLLTYENRTDPEGPAMTHAMFAIGWLEVGEEERAAKAFLKNYEHIEQPFQVWTEQRRKRGAINFITGAGGFLQAVLFGYGGFRIREDQLYFDPKLPPTSNTFTITGVDYLGSSLKFIIKNKKMRITLTEREQIAPALELVIYKKVYPLEHKNTLLLLRGPGFIRMRRD